jgi:hypothetical protein
MGGWLFIMSKHGNLKRGTVREDGKIFLRYQSNGSELWVTLEYFDKFIKSIKEKNEVNKHENKIKRKIYRQKNREKLLQYSKNYSIKNRKKVNEKLKKWREANKEHVLETGRILYHKNRKKRCDQSWAYQKKRKENDLFFKTKINIRILILNSFKKNGYSKKSKVFNILGCSFQDFKAHIESQFQPGMSWENRHLWHIDHIMPVSMAKTYDEVVRLNHYKNLRPLWAHENLSKSDKTPEILVLF